MFILINLKAYDCDPIEIAAAAANAETSQNVNLAVAPQLPSLDSVSDYNIETWSQHIDPIDYGSHTGSVLPESVAAAGATGTLINHSEERLKLADIDDAIQSATRAGLSTVVCANNPNQAAAVAHLGPDAIAIEPPELIGSGTPVSKADPNIVEDAVAAVTAVDESVDVYCGAGISSGEDVAAADRLGADGVLLASGVAKSDSPRSVIEDLASGITS